MSNSSFSAKRFTVVCGLLIVFVFAHVFQPGGYLSAATYRWDGGGGSNRDWSYNLNWSDDIVPTASDIAKIGTGTLSPATAYVTQTGMVCDDLYLGESSTHVGTLYITGGSLTTNDVHLGDDGTGVIHHSAGTMTVRTGKRLWLAHDSGTTANGTYNLSDTGTLNAALQYVGYNNVGTFNQSGGTNIVTTLTIAADATATGTYRLSGGTLQVWGDVVKGAGSATFVVDGGTVWMNTNATITAGNFIVGRDPGSNGSFTISGGRTVTATANLTVGGYGTGTFTQNTSTGYNVSAAGLVLGEYSGSLGTYNLQAATLNVAGAATIGASGTAVFNQSGGTFSFNETSYVGRYNGGNGTYTITAGTITGSGDMLYIGSAAQTANGRFEWFRNPVGTFTNTTLVLTSRGTLAMGHDFHVHTLAGGGYTAISGLNNATLEVTRGAIATHSTGNWEVVNLRIGSDDGAGTYNLSGGSGTATGTCYVGSLGGSGTLNVSAGTATVGTLRLGDVSSTGAIALSGTGVLRATGQIHTQAGSTMSIGSGTTLDAQNTAWTNNAAITMTGGSIIGQTMTQSGTLNASSGVSSVQRVTFASAGTHSVGNGATLRVTTAGTLSGATISGAAGTFNVASGAAVDGYGNIYPAVVIDGGTLNANSGAGSLVLWGAATLNSSGQLLGSGGTSLSVKGLATVNSGSIVASNNTTINLEGGATVGGTVRANGGTVNAYGSFTVGVGARAYSSASSTLTFQTGSSIYNRGAIDADSGVVQILGTIKSGSTFTGDFSATSATMSISGTIEANCYNTFTAKTGGTITFSNDLSTANFHRNDALRPQGGTLTLSSGRTLTVDVGDTVAGYGTVLAEGRNLVNHGTIDANGALTVRGNITNNGLMRADAPGDTLTIGSTLVIGVGGEISASGGALVQIQSPLTNNGTVRASGAGSRLAITNDASPDGTGAYVANNAGTIEFPAGFTNADMTFSDALQPQGGTITVKSGALTNVLGKRIIGYGSVLDTGLGGPRTLINDGDVIAQGGTLTIHGDVSNAGSMTAEAGTTLQVNGTVSNSSTVAGVDGGSIIISALQNSGSVSIDGGGQLQVGTAAGPGVWSISTGRMVFTNSLVLDPGATIVDNDMAAVVEAHGNLTNWSKKFTAFDADHLTIRVFSLAVVPPPHRVTWLAQDKGRELAGLDENLAVGTLVLGDGLGAPGSETFEFSPDTIIYCYGLHILSDASVNLNGATIYYLKDGYVYNGITGTGFADRGEWYGGEILELPQPSGQQPIPEPACLALVGGAILALRRRRK